MSSDDTNQLCVFGMIKALLYNNEEWEQWPRLLIFCDFHSQLLKSPLFNDTLLGLKYKKRKYIISSYFMVFITIVLAAQVYQPSGSSAETY